MPRFIKKEIIPKKTFFLGKIYKLAIYPHITTIPKSTGPISSKNPPCPALAGMSASFAIASDALMEMKTAIK